MIRVATGREHIVLRVERSTSDDNCKKFSRFKNRHVTVTVERLTELEVVHTCVFLVNQLDTMEVHLA